MPPSYMREETTKKKVRGRGDGIFFFFVSSEKQKNMELSLYCEIHLKCFVWYTEIPQSK